MNVELPNGEIAEFPDDMPHAEIQGVLQKQFGAPKKASISDYLGSALKNAGKGAYVGLSEAGRGIRNLGQFVGFPEAKKPNYTQEMGITPEQQDSGAFKAGEIVGEVAPAFALGPARMGQAGMEAVQSIPTLGKYLATALQNRAVQTAIPQALYASATVPGDKTEAGLTAGGISGVASGIAEGIASQSPLTRVLSRGALGLGTGLLGYGGAKVAGQGDLTSALIGAGSGILGAKYGVNPKRITKEEVLKGVEGTNYKDALKAAERLELSYLTPAEASANPFTGAAQGGVGKTEKGAQILFEKGKERAASEKKAIQNMLGNIFNPEEHTALRESLYDSVKSKLIPEEKIAPFRQNERFKAAEKNVLADPDYREALKDVPENSVEYLDMIKRSMGDTIEEAKDARKTTKAKLAKKTQKDLVKMMDAEVPEYSQARGIAERGILRTKLEDYFKKKSESMTGTNLGKFLSNDKRYTELQHGLRNAPEAQAQLADMKMIFHRLINIPTAKTAEALERSSMSKDRATSATATRLLKEVLSGGRADKTAVELITNPKWAEELEKLKGISNTDKFISKSADILGKVAAQESVR